MQLSKSEYVSKTLIERSQKIGNCWIWIRAKTGSGYGTFKRGSNYVLAHRMSYELFKGSIKEGLFICHSCDNRSCINPNHLWEGTQSENMKDCFDKGRSGLKFGDKHPNAKLSFAKARKIRELYSSGNIDQYQLASKFGVHRNIISAVINKRIWL